MEVTIKKTFAFSFLLIILIAGCNTYEDIDEIGREVPDGEYRFNEGYILVNSDTLVADSDFEVEHINLEIKGLQKKYESIVLLRYEDPSMLQGIKSGDKVKLQYSLILESNPPKATVSKIKKLLK
ncbi:DUF3221 domain-containing protein [Halobacillus sp. Marseille-P3879]|uniref:DUF3221 domain-containing protein n=1 Tax=Halobacillus sp. Marseille-P3879 TaxID=2045014 RepID=UPI001356F706